MGHKYGDIIRLKPGTIVELSTGGVFVENTDRLWAVDEYIEEQKFLNINRVLEPYPGAYCGYVHEEDIAEALP